MSHGEAPVLVIGAGPAGLTAGLELLRLGAPALLLERDPVVGGLSRTVEANGYRFDLGGHRFFTKSREVQAIWRELLGDDLLERPRLSRIHYGGKYFDYPLRPLAALSSLGPLEALRILASWAHAQLFPSLVQESFEDWVVARFGRRLFQIFFETYTEKIWGIPCREISPDWADQRIRNLDLAAALKTALLGKRERGGEVVVSLIEKFHYPRLGPGMMWERCRARLAEGGVETWTGATVERVHHDGGRVTGVTARRDGLERRLPIAACISSMPLRELISALDPSPPAVVRAAAERLRYRDFMTVAVVVERAELFPDNWIYVHSPEVRVGRIQNFKNWSPEMVPDPGTTCLGLEYFVQEADDLWRAPDSEIVALAVRELERIGLAGGREVRGAKVVRVPKAYPVYDHSYREVIATLRGWLSSIENLEVVGRNGQHRYNNQDHSMLSGLCAARNRVHGLRGLPPAWDVWAVNADREYLEEGRESRPADPAAEGDRRSPRPRGGALAGSTGLEELLAAAFGRYDALALGGAVGIVAALALATAAVVSWARGGESQGPTLSLLASYLPSYRQTPAGTLVGVVEAGLGGFLFGVLLARAINAVVGWTETSLRRRLQLQAALDPLEGRPR